jgi:hypothetical protein
MERYNNSFLVSASEADISKWMLEKNMAFSATDSQEKNNPLALKLFLVGANKTLKEKFSSAGVMALENWDPQKHSLESLENLALFAGQIRNFEMIHGLIKLVDENKIPEKEGENKTKRIVISVVAGFPKEMFVKNALERWFGDEKIDPKYSDLLFFGLTAAYPERVESYLPKVLKSFDDHPDYFFFSLITTNLLEYVGREKAEKMLKKFDSESASELIREIDERLVEN